MGMPVEPTFSQASFRARDNVPDPGTLDAAFDAGDTGLNGDFSYGVDTQFRIRFLIQQTLATTTDNSTNIGTEFLLQYNHSASPGWNTVTDSTPIQFALSSGFANHDNTAAQLLGAGTRIDGDALETSGATDTITFTQLSLTETELEVSLTIDSAQVDNNDTIQLQWLYSADDETPPATVLEDYSNTPTITVVEVVGPTTIEMGYATLVSSAQSLDAISDQIISMGIATLASSAQAFDVVSDQTISMGTATLASTAQTLSQVDTFALSTTLADIELTTTTVNLNIHYLLSGDKYYVIGLNRLGTRINIWKSTAADITVLTNWATPAGWSLPVYMVTWRSVASVVDGTDIHIVAQDGYTVRYFVFDTATDTWTIKDELISKPAWSTGQCDVGIVVRSDGDIVVAYQFRDASIDYMCYYSRKESGTWTYDIEMYSDSPDNVTRGPALALGADDRVHMRTSDVDFKATQRVLNSSNVLQTATKIGDQYELSKDELSSLEIYEYAGSTYGVWGLLKLSSPRFAWITFTSADVPALTQNEPTSEFWVTQSPLCLVNDFQDGLPSIWFFSPVALDKDIQVRYYKHGDSDLTSRDEIVIAGTQMDYRRITGVAHRRSGNPDTQAVIIYSDDVDDVVVLLYDIDLDKIISMSPATLVSSAQALDVLPGAITVGMGVATLVSASEALTVATVAPQTITMGVATLVSSTQPLTLELGAVTIPMNTVTLVSSAQTLDVSLATIIAMSPATLVSSPQALTLALGAISISMDVATLASSAQALDVTATAPGAQTINMGVVTLPSSPQALSVVAFGATQTVSLGAITLASAPQTLSVLADQVVAMQAVTLASTARQLDTQPGGVIALMQALTLASSVQGIAVSIGVTTIQMQAVALSATPTSLDIVAGSTTIQMGVASLTLSPQSLAVIFIVTIVFERDLSGSRDTKVSLKGSI